MKGHIPIILDSPYIYRLPNHENTPNALGLYEIRLVPAPAEVQDTIIVEDTHDAHRAPSPSQDQDADLAARAENAESASVSPPVRPRNPLRRLAGLVQAARRSPNIVSSSQESMPTSDALQAPPPAIANAPNLAAVLNYQSTIAEPAAHALPPAPLVNTVSLPPVVHPVPQYPPGVRDSVLLAYNGPEETGGEGGLRTSGAAPAADVQSAEEAGARAGRGRRRVRFDVRLVQKFDQGELGNEVQDTLVSQEKPKVLPVARIIVAHARVGILHSGMVVDGWRRHSPRRPERRRLHQSDKPHGSF
ncbi:hypothetical protein H0H81_002592 [Sphagnurus paluster]|uniref:Uncharacterized protein n=1 Tax=Sphagnurus paluster TaxID=117069 RepID=A0A9P7FZX6_9AGAR|nr:hypothetical protein H0H81_002592 [Sphagnurus paluster]